MTPSSRIRRLFERKRTRRFKLRNAHAIELMEDRTLLSVFSVNVLGDALDQTPLGDGIVDTDLETPGLQITLTAAIQESNANADVDEIAIDDALANVLLDSSFVLAANDTIAEKYSHLWATFVVLQADQGADVVTRRSGIYDNANAIVTFNITAATIGDGISNGLGFVGGAALRAVSNQSNGRLSNLNFAHTVGGVTNAFGVTISGVSGNVQISDFVLNGAAGQSYDEALFEVSVFGTDEGKNVSFTKGEAQRYDVNSALQYINGAAPNQAMQIPTEVADDSNIGDLGPGFRANPEAHNAATNWGSHRPNIVLGAGVESSDRIGLGGQNGNAFLLAKNETRVLGDLSDSVSVESGSRTISDPGLFRINIRLADTEVAFHPGYAHRSDQAHSANIESIGRSFLPVADFVHEIVGLFETMSDFVMSAFAGDPAVGTNLFMGDVSEISAQGNFLVDAVSQGGRANGADVIDELVEKADAVLVSEHHYEIRDVLQTVSIESTSKILHPSRKPIIVDAPQNGMLKVEANGSIVYRPHAGYQGTDSFTYLSYGQDQRARLESITVDVHPSAQFEPVIVDAVYQVEAGETVAGTLSVTESAVASGFEDIAVAASAAAAWSVVASKNDQRSSRKPRFRLLSGTSHGVLKLGPDGTFAYNPHHGFEGCDVFTYEDSVRQTVSNVTIDVVAPRQLPSSAIVTATDTTDAVFQRVVDWLW